MDGVEEEGRESQGKRNLERERAKRGQPWRRRAIARARLLPHQRLRAIAPALLFLKAAAISPARTTTASAFFHSLSSSSSFFPSTSLPPLQAFFHQFPDCRRAKLGYYRRCYLPSCPSLSPPISSSVFLLLVRFPILPHFARPSRSFSSFFSFYFSLLLFLSRAFVVWNEERGVWARGRPFVWPLRARRRTAIF